MNKKDFVKFIEKYHLAGNCEQVKITSDANKVSTAFKTQDKNLIGEVHFDGLELEDAEIGIFETSKLLKILGALNDEVNITVNKIGDKCTNLKIKDTSTEASYLLADLQVIDKDPSLKKLPPFTLEIKITPEFTEKFIKAKAALPDAVNFAVVKDSLGTRVVLNYSTTNATTMTFDVNGTGDDVEAITFSAPLLREVLVANKDLGEGVLRIAPMGLAQVEFKNENTKSIYHLAKVKLID